MTESAGSPATPGVDKTGERVRAMFAGVARRYDLLNHVLSLNIDKRWRRTTVKRVAPEGLDPILDVCTGTGDLALGYADATDGKARVVGTDFTPEMLAIAREKARKRGRDIEFLEADTLQLPFEDDQFQIVSVAFGLRNVADTVGGLKEMIRVARPGGRVAVLEFSRPRVPILKQLYLAYFKYLLPRIGQAVSNSTQQAYHYLPASVTQFPDGPELTALMERCGLREVSYTPMTLGVATLYVGRKPTA